MTKTPAKKRKRWLLYAVLCLVVPPCLCLLALYYYFSHDLPRIASLQDYTPALVSRVYSAGGELIGEYFVERRYVVGLDAISPLLIQAIIAAEDDSFFEHSGINLVSILRAAIKNIRSLEIKQGGSTITQQIVKSLLLTPERSFSRKIKEAILATRIEKSLSKDDILTLYLNQIYFGKGAYGVEAAAKVFFNKTALELNLAEASFLAGLIKAPNYYRVASRGKHRQEYVLTRMQKLGFITGKEKRAAVKEDLLFTDPVDLNTLQAPYFVEHVRRQIEKRYGADMLYREGLRIETTVDMSMQQAAQEAVRRGIEAYEKRTDPEDNATGVQAALLCMAPFSGEVSAMVGGRDYRDSQFNRALQARRQPGSAFKPIIYAAALDKGYTAASTIVDSPLLYEIEDEEGFRFWEPQNYDNTFKGITTFRTALTHSRNIVTIKILKEIGVPYTVQYAEKLGIEGTFNRDLSLALGSCGISLASLVKAYGAFCAGGLSPQLRYVSRILDRNGDVLFENRTALDRVLSPQTAYLMTSLLQSVVEEGTGRRVRALNRPCAGKTGTTNEVRDAWFIGFTPGLVTGVWVGFDDLTPLGKHETGAVAAAPVWLDFMQAALKNKPVKPFAVPEGILFVRINPETGFFPESEDDKTIFECFKEGTVPTQF